MFEIRGVFAEKFTAKGEVLRLKNTFVQYLNTEKGVMAFIDEMKPFVEISITDYTTKKDKTEYFLG